MNKQHRTDYNILDFAKNKCGIYKITNIANGKVYIGQAKNIKARWRSEIHDAFYPKCFSYNTALSRAYRKYCKDGQEVLTQFKYDILEECSIEELEEKEKYWISKIPCHRENGYNETTGGKDGYKVSPTKEWFKFINEIEKLLQDMAIPQYKIRDKYQVPYHFIERINKGYYREFSSNNMVYPIRKSHAIPSRQPKITKGNISVDIVTLIDSGITSPDKMVPLLGISKTTLNKFITKTGLREYLNRKRVEIREAKKPIKKIARDVPVVRIDKNGNEVCFANAKTAGDAINKPATHITDCCRGGRASAYGYKWKYIV